MQITVSRKNNTLEVLRDDRVLEDAWVSVAKDASGAVLTLGVVRGGMVLTIPASEWEIVATVPEESAAVLEDLKTVEKVVAVDPFLLR